MTNAVSTRPARRRRSPWHGTRRLVVDVTNELPAAHPASDGHTGTGLLTMRERAEALGGTQSAGPCRYGWRVHAKLPVEGASS